MNRAAMVNVRLVFMETPEFMGIISFYYGEQ